MTGGSEYLADAKSQVAEAHRHSQTQLSGRGG